MKNKELLTELVARLAKVEGECTKLKQLVEELSGELNKIKHTEINLDDFIKKPAQPIFSPPWQPFPPYPAPLPPTKWPAPNLPSMPTLPIKNHCPICGIDFGLSTGYVCGNMNCPIQPKIT